MAKNNGVEEKRREWSRIMSEEAHDGSDDGPSGDPSSGKNDKLRGLLSLIIKTKKIRFSEVVRALDIDAKELETIASVLEKKKLISIPNRNNIDPTIEASEFLTRKIRERSEKKKVSGPVDVNAFKKQLLSQRDELIKKTKELEEEYKKRVELEERLRNVEKQLGSEVSEKEKLEELRQQLMKEREDRIRLEEKLKHEQSHLAEQENELKKRGRELLEMEINLKKKQDKIDEEEEELELLYGDEKELKEKRQKVKKEIEDTKKKVQEITKKDEGLSEKEKKIGDEEETLKRMDFSLRSREDGVERREKDVIKKEETIKTKEEELEAKEQRVKDEEKELKKKATILRRIKDKIIKEKEEVSSKEELLKKEADALITESKQIEKRLIEESEELKRRGQELHDLLKGEIKKLSDEEIGVLSKEEPPESAWPPKPPPLPPAGDGGPGDESSLEETLIHDSGFETKGVAKKIPEDKSRKQTKAKDMPQPTASEDESWPPKEPPPIPPQEPKTSEKTQIDEISQLETEIGEFPKEPPKSGRKAVPERVLKNELAGKEALERRDRLEFKEAELEGQLEELSNERKKNKDDLLKIVAAESGIKVEDAVKKIGVERKTVEEWAQQLQADGIIEVKKKLIGGSTLDIIRGAAEKVRTQKEDEELTKIREELKRIRGEGSG